MADRVLRELDSTTTSSPVRYAVVGLGHIAQSQVLPAFQHARENSRLVALLGSDDEQLRELAARYEVQHVYGKDDYARLLANPAVEAVFLCLPNHLHRDYTVQAATAGKHVLCEKPMAVTERECEEMEAAAARHDVRLMIAYRLHFEAANLRAIELVQSGKVGEPRIFSSTFPMQVREGDSRTKASSGGVLYDIGIYCINAARYLFRAEPTEVQAWAYHRAEPRFAEIAEAYTCQLRFPEERAAMFACSFGAEGTPEYRLLGTAGELRVTNPYSYAGDIEIAITRHGIEEREVFGGRDQFAAELTYFSHCIRQAKQPEPNPAEGRADIRIIEALLRSVQTGRAVRLESAIPQIRPAPQQSIHKPPLDGPAELVKTQSPSR